MDSNPRGSCDPSGFQDRRLRPLGQASAETLHPHVYWVWSLLAGLLTAPHPRNLQMSSVRPGQVTCPRRKERGLAPVARELQVPADLPGSHAPPPLHHAATRNATHIAGLPQGRQTGPATSCAKSPGRSGGVSFVEAFRKVECDRRPRMLCRAGTRLHRGSAGNVRDIMRRRRKRETWRRASDMTAGPSRRRREDQVDQILLALSEIRR